MAPATLDHLLFVSGTASIVGHQNRHQDDPSSQLAETLRNLHAVIESAATPASPRLEALKIFLRRPEDQVAVERELAAAYGELPRLYLAADICRHELRIEIEAVASTT